MNGRILIVAVLVVAIESIAIVVDERRAVTSHQRHSHDATGGCCGESFDERSELRIRFDVQRFRAAVWTTRNVLGDKPLAM